MGEAKQEEAKAETKTEEEVKQVDKKEENPEEKKEEKKDEATPASPPPTVLFVDLHCVGCAKKIERTILKCRGVEAVEMEMTKNQVTVKGIVDPQALCERIKKKTMRSAKVLSPLPPADGDPAKPDAAPPQNAMELNVNMHCEACAEQLQKKILKMRGVQTAETNLSASKVTVTGTMNADKLVEYVYRRTRKLAKIVPQPPKEEEPKKEDGEQKAEEKPSEEKKEETNEEAKKEDEKAEKKEEEKPSQPQENGGEGAKEEKPAEGGAGGEEQKKEGERAPDTVVLSAPGDDDMAKRMMYWAPVYGAPVYMIERLPPPPQLFSDENPNACCIS
ncbi:hypothetical protein Taro_046542 [Colocasia esculenta]|uniref:HMA domain-containing protein n=1 Tax=Colocasia esculenta TaxID=4460 RepID=A0A843X7H3_COLES|nr:hypothetical protein [Colocasia esculenta]